MTASCALQLLSPFDNALLAHDPMVMVLVHIQTD